jgi:hypothetical protein
LQVIKIPLVGDFIIGNEFLIRNINFQKSSSSERRDPGANGGKINLSCALVKGPDAIKILGEQKRVEEAGTHKMVAYATLQLS